MGFLGAILRVFSVLLRVAETASGVFLVTRGLGSARSARAAGAAIREPHNPEAARLDLERARLEAERWRMEEGLRLDRVRQAAARRLGELLLIAWIAVAGWVVSALLSLGAGSEITTGAKGLLGIGWVLLLGALACVLRAHARIARECATRLEDGSARLTCTSSAATLARWLLVAGLGLTGASFLVMLG